MFLKKIKTSFSHGSAARDVTTLTLGTMFAQVITLMATPLLTRFYLPADFGNLAVFLTLSGIAATLVTGRYETSILVPKEDAEAANLVYLSLLLAMISSLFLFVISLFLPSALWEIIGLGDLENWVPLAFVVGCSISIAAIIQVWLNRKKKYLTMAKLRIFQSIGLAGLALCFAYFRIELSGLLLTQLAVCFLMAIISIWLIRSTAEIWKRGNLWVVARIHKNAPKYLLPTALLDVATLSLPVILIAVWFDESMVGQFVMAWRLLMLPMALIGGAIGQIFMQRFSFAYRDSLNARKLLQSTWMILLAIGFVPLVFLFIFGEELFSFVLGDEWKIAGLMASILAPMALAIFISSPTSGTYIILGIQRYSPYFAFASFVYRPGCLYYGFYRGDLMIGLKLWVFFELMQIAIYQIVAWKKINE